MPARYVQRAIRVLLLGLAAVLPGAATAQSPSGTPIDFSRQIRPILSDNCFACHGPDAGQRKARLRLDTREGALAKLRGGSHAIVPGQPAQSALIERITAHDDTERMPPPKTNKRLTSAQVELLRQWIAQGARYTEHWAFVAPRRPPVPAVKQKDWPRNPVDAFLLARMEKEGLRPAPRAEPHVLARRLALDLTGLPPTPEEVDAFEKQFARSPQAAVEALTDRLMASPHYGERLALDWLDAARFADTHGYHIDAGRDMTLWREWVIDAFQKNVPFDRFTVEQLAGDLLPGATTAQKIASGFNRNHMINFEGGAIPAEYHAAYIIDRVNTTTTVWLGLTAACAQCHDHKYDPLSQREYYRLYAFFHNVPENGLDGSRGNAAPLVRAPSKAQQAALAEFDRKIRMLEAGLVTSPTETAAQRAWEKSLLAAGPTSWTPLTLTSLKSHGGATFTSQPDGSTLVGGANPATDTFTIEAEVPLSTVTALRLHALPHTGFSGNGPGRSVNGNFVMTNVRAETWTPQGFRPLAWERASADFNQKDYDVSRAIDADGRTGWAIHPAVGKAHAAIFSLRAPVKGTDKVRLRLTLDFHSTYGRHALGRFRLEGTGAAAPHNTRSLPADVLAIVKTPSEERSSAQTTRLRAYYRANVATGGPSGELARLRKARAALEKSFPTAMVMQEMPSPRVTHVLMRGEYDKKGEKVTAGVPSFLPPLPAGAPSNRLGLARWLVSREHPLTARVIVNRYWQMIFGTGLVKTAEDFGSQGELPSHPELLDWLAVQFVEDGWDVKKLVKRLVTSAAYQQSSKVTPALLARDPENRLLARGPRLRLQAEFIRDQALALSGLLNREVGGASVSPYQPEGLWQELASRQDSKNWSAQFFVQSHGKDLYRRTMYTFWKRTSPPPSLLTFDAPDRETCTVRRSRTNTPLQALVLMNDPTYVEASRKLAERMMRHAKEPTERLRFAFRLATARAPSEREQTILTRVLERQRAKYAADRPAALKLLRVGESSHDEALPPSELAAYTIVASVILNLDEVVTKN